VENLGKAGLNPEQKKAVTWDRGHLLVLAGAGTGKTRVLTSRLAWVVAQGQAHFGEVLAVTFTNKASEEMRSRVAALARRDVTGSWIGTFHSIAHRLLRIHGKEVGLRGGFQIIDKGDQTTIARRLLAEAGGRKEEARDMVGFISRAKEMGLTPTQTDPSAPNARRWVQMYEAYDAYLREQNKVDFGDLMMRSRDLLMARPEIRAHYVERFRHVLVDEFQDTSPFQYEWLKLFRGEDNRYFAVGDDDQSVYGFRSADPEIMQHYRREFGVEEVVRLETNYRSQPHILDAANALIGRNTNRIGKTLRASEGAAPKAKIALRGFGTDLDEAEFVAQAARELQHKGERLDAAAVIYRTNAQSQPLEKALTAVGVPYRIYGGQRFFDRKEVKDAIAYLRLAIDPGDREALLRVINFPPRGIGDTTLRQLQADPLGIPAAIERLGEENRRVGEFRGLLREIESAHRREAGPSELLKFIYGASGLRKHYEEKKADLERVENLDQLVSAASLFEQESGEDGADLADFVSYASLDSGKADNRGDGGINLMTAHAAKGLEFDAVHIVGVEEALFPHQLAWEPRDVEEERRLMYVAITRARRLLHLTYARSRMEFGQHRRSKISRFVGELPAAVIEEYAPASTEGRGQFRRRPGAAQWQAKAQRKADASPKFPPMEGGGHKPGDYVSHPSFGKGVVIAVHPGASAPVVEVSFKNHGKRKIDTSIVPLSPAQ